MTEMLAAQYDEYGAPDVLRVNRIRRPEVRSGHLLVRVSATSINSADVMVRSGKLKLFSGSHFPRGTGFDFTGHVVDVGSETIGFQIGDGVWGFLNGIRQGPAAGAAEFVLAPVDSIAHLPQRLDVVSAAALPGAAGAALGVLRDTIAVQKGDRVLIRGAGGGVGTSAVQIARALGGRVTAIARADHLGRLQDLGAAEAFDYRSVDASRLGQFDVIFDPVGRDMRTFRRLLSPMGRMAAIIIGSLSDAAYTFASVLHGSRRVRFVQSPPHASILRSLTEMVDAGNLRPVVESVTPLSEIAEVHRSFEAGGTFGKRIVRVRHAS